MATIEVIRARPPELAHCRAKACRRLIEWVPTAATGRRMPVDHPLLVEHVFERENGTLLVTIDSKCSHFATCPAAAQFRRTRTTQAGLLFLLIATLSASCALPLRRTCLDGWPVRILQHPQCPRGICGYTCAPDRWRGCNTKEEPCPSISTKK